MESDLNAPSTLLVRLRAMSWEAQSIMGLELVPLPPMAQLPAFTAGAHIDLHLATRQGLVVRSYSLLNDPNEIHRYCLGINLDAHSRGGSAFVHSGLRVGDVLTIGVPRNHFPLDEGASHNVFIAGGIGITPMISMIARSKTLGIPWTLHYATRTRGHAGFLNQLQAFADQSAGQLMLNFDQESGGKMLDLNAIASDLPSGAHIYCCGPVPMLQAYELATKHLPAERVHKEYFAAKDAPSSEGGFTLELRRSQKSLQVPSGKTILDCLIEIHAEPAFSCREGVCGTCEVRVLEGTPDHRDMVLSESERSANDRIMVCCSGSKTPRLVLDL